MSRWTEEFEQHTFQQSWAQLKIQLDNIEIDDKTVITSVQELARLKRVVSYLDALIENLDPELTPRTVWGNFQTQTDACLQNLRAYASDKNINGIIRANDNADNLLTYLRPYEVFQRNVAKGYRSAAKSLISDIEDYIKSFHERASVITEELEKRQRESEDFFNSIEKNEIKASALASKLFDCEDDSLNMEKKLDNLLDTADSKTKIISDLHSRLIEGTVDNPSIQARILALKSDIEENKIKLSGILEGAQNEITQLGVFYEKIFGQVDDQGNVNGGLSHELDERTEKLRLFEIEQSKKYNALLDQIETLLPGATSAGLGSAYRSLKEEFSHPINTYTKLFHLSIAAMVLGSLVMTTSHISFYPILSIEFIKMVEWDEVVKALLYKAPFIAPVVWLAVFSAKRRSQYERLQQEYSHKEALASSYESYRRQLQDLKVGAEELQHELLSKTIEAISYNASVTLDGKHDEKLPIQLLLDKFSLDDLKNLLDIARKKNI